MTRDHEEIVNTLTHAAGIVAGLIGGAALIVVAALSGNARLIVGAAVFVATLILLYTASTLYHFSIREEVKRRLKVLDHSAIYLLIAGTYTPFTLAGLGGAWGWSLFGVIWGLAAAGVVFKLFFTGRFGTLSTAIYVAMGWLVLIAIVPMIRALSPATLSWLVAGGVIYTAGTVFYHSKRPYMHGVWHLFVLAGSVCHAVAVATL
ncbi:MAG TPA: hemolysin III family protein [Longimicrobiales bacterium]